MGFHLKLGNIKFLQIDGSNWQDISHSHEDVYQISVPLNGELIAMLNHSEIALKNGQSLAANPSAVHQHRFGPEMSSIMIIGLHRKTLNQWFREKYQLYEEIELDQSQLIFPNELKQKVKKWMIGLVTNDYRQFSYTAELEDNIFQYFSSVLKGSHHPIRKSFLPTYIASDYGMNQVFEYIHSNYSENILIETLAALAGQSKYHFIRCFKKVTNLTPYQYLLMVRIEKGVELLRTSKKSIADISYDLGFSTPGQFYRYFYRHKGYTPKEFRDNIR